MRESVTMSHRDLDRIYTLKKVLAKEISQVLAGKQLGVSERQVRRLVIKLKNEGPKGVVSKLVGKPGNRRLPAHMKQRVLALLREKYEGFGPTFAAEKLLELEGLKISSETVRQWMIEANLWVLRRKRAKVHMPRARRACFGELIQADGSQHRWFGEDGPQVNATVLVDDATSAITGLYFSETETLDGYFEALEQHLCQYGRPLALYTDHWSSFGKNREGTTQMRRVLKGLNTELILASSPQAKGRIERANRTLQDRLGKEMRLRGVKTIGQANAYAAEFVREYNKKFSKKPMSDSDAHRPLAGYDLERILCRYEERVLNSCGIFHHNNKAYQVQGISGYRSLNKRRVEIRVTKRGQMRVFLGDRELKILALDQILETPRELSRKEVLVWKSKRHAVSITHPWKAALRRETIKKSILMLK